MRITYKIGFATLSVFIILNSCNPSQVTYDDAVAQVYSDVLREVDLEELFPSNGNTKNEALRKAYIEKWIRQRLMIKEAQKNNDANNQIEALVDDYRASLLKLKYEEQVISENLDSVVTQAELNQNYIDNKSQYTLTHPIAKMYLSKISTSFDGIKHIDQLWDEGKWSIAQNVMAKIPSSSFSVDTMKWISLEDLKLTIPTEILDDIDANADKGRTEKVEKYKYYLKVFDFVDKNEEPPLDYIANKLKKVILHKRKQVIMKEKMEILYEDELRKNNIKVYPRS